MKNHYQTLGVLPDASADDIRIVYRRLAMRYHPDRPGGDAAKFNEIQTAFNVLIDVVSRHKYDVELIKVLRRAKKAEIEKSIIDIHISLYDAYHGTKIKAPDGTIIEIPRGVNNGETIGPVRVNTVPNNTYARSGADLLLDVTITVIEAACGTTVNLHHLSGDQITIKIPCGIQPGQILHVAGAGMPSKDNTHGDLLVRVQVRIPTDLTDAQKQSLEFLGFRDNINIHGI